MIDIIADYKDWTGQDFHRPYKALTLDPIAAAYRIVDLITDSGYIPIAIHRIRGDHTLDELKEIADSEEKASKQVFDLLWANVEGILADFAKQTGR